MCQLTLIDIMPETKLAKATIRSLTEINSVGILKYSPQNNEDGFGYMTFSKAPFITKSEKCAIEWWAENQDEFQRTVRNANGIYHVRSASKNIRTLYQKDAHPFNVGNIILAHNGTLDDADKLKDDKELQKIFPVTKNDKNVEIPMIDSEKYAKSQEYTRVTTRFTLVENMIMTSVTILFILLGGFNWIDTIARSFGQGTILTGLVFDNFKFGIFISPFCILIWGFICVTRDEFNSGVKLIERKLGFKKRCTIAN